MRCDCFSFARHNNSAARLCPSDTAYEDELHLNSLSAGEQRSRGTFLQDSLKHIHVSLGRDIHVAHGPEVRYRTPSALCVIIGLRFLIDALQLDRSRGG